MSDPIGAETARAILDKTIVLTPLPAWRDPAITVFSLVIMGAGIVLSFRVVRKLTKKCVADSGWRSVVFYLIPGLFGGAFLAMLLAWRVFAL
jgi:hypothetical protein